MKKKIKILFRTGGGREKGKELGLGHIFRCINLANFFETKQIYFLLEDFGGAKKVLNSFGHKKINLIQKNLSKEKEIEITKKLINELKIDVLVIDRYKIDPNYVKKMKKIIKTVVISDLKNISFDADLIINGFIGYENKIQYNKYGTKCLLGPKYQILNKKITRYNQDKTKSYDFLATFGGIDEKNISELIFKTITKENIKIKKCKIIFGPAKKIKQGVIEQNKNKKIELVRESKNIFKDMVKTKIGFCAGGITSYEFACLRIPFVVICQVKHQLETAKEWDKKGFAINLGLPNKLTPKKIRKILENKNNLKLSNNRKIIDGNGGFRAKREICNLVFKKIT